MTTTSPWDSSWTGYAAARDRFFAGLAARDRAAEGPSATEQPESPPDGGEDSARTTPRSSSPAS